MFVLQGGCSQVHPTKDFRTGLIQPLGSFSLFAAESCFDQRAFHFHDADLYALVESLGFCTFCHNRDSLTHSGLPF